MELTNEQAVAVILERLGNQDEELGEIKKLARATNGRVTELETQRKIRDALEKAQREQVAKDLQRHDEEIAAVEKKRDRWSTFVRGMIVAGAGSAFGSLVYLLGNGIH